MNAFGQLSCVQTYLRPCIPYTPAHIWLPGIRILSAVGVDALITCLPHTLVPSPHLILSVFGDH